MEARRPGRRPDARRGRPGRRRAARGDPSRDGACLAGRGPARGNSAGRGGDLAHLLHWTGYADAARHPERRHHRPRRPREDHAGRRDALAGRHLPRERVGPRADHGLDRPRAGEGHHDHGEEHRDHLSRDEDQHRGHARPRGLRGRGRAHPDAGRRRPPPGRRRRGPAAPDPLRAAEGPRGRAPAGRRDQQDRPGGRPAGPGPGRGLRPVHRPRRRREPAGLPGDLHRRPPRHGHRAPGRARAHPRAPLRGACSPRCPRPATTRPWASSCGRPASTGTTTWGGSSSAA